MKKTFLFILLCSAMTVSAQQWITHFAYNNVTQIAMTDDLVYAISDGSLFSVNKQTEQIKTYNRESGLHSSGINCIHYDRVSDQLFIAYKTGKIDLLSKHGVKYIGELYDKDMTQEKTIYNVTIHKRTAYLSTAYGIQTFDLSTNRLVDSYWLRPNGQETHVQDVLIANDSIYAFTTDSLFVSALHSNLVDYTVWERELRSGRISPDADKGIHYQDDHNHWYVGHAEGIVRFTTTSRLTYKPQGPLVNVPYRMKATGNRLGIVQGGYAIPTYGRDGMIMLLDNNQWKNYNHAYLHSHLGIYTRDYSDILFDPNDNSHFFIATFGYGLIEFRKDTFYHHHTPDNSILETVINTQPYYPYAWVDGLQWDDQGNLWMLNNSANGIKILQPDGKWIGISNDACKSLDRSKDILISVKKPTIKFISSIRNGIGVFDDNGTIEDQSDDRAVLCNTFRDDKGKDITFPRISSFFQTSSGILLIGTDQGFYQIDNPEDILNGDTRCTPVNLSLPQEGKTNIFENEHITCIAQDDKAQIWIGTQYTGVYCITPDLKEITQHFSIDNCSMPSNDILSLCWMNEKQSMFIGTAEGLIEYNTRDTYEKLEAEDTTKDHLSQGDMQQWRLHLSYANPQEIAATPQHIYAMANGSLFGVDRTTDEIVYYNKHTGLNGTDITHIAYDSKAEKLVIAYGNGLIDLLDEDGNVVQIPDLSIKAGSIPVTINCITVGSKYTYLGMPFGIIAINTAKAEVADTYYIGDEASSIDIQQIVELGDSIYAFSYDRMYKAALKDNLIDYRLWQPVTLPCEKVQQAVGFNKQLYTLQHDSLYTYGQGEWQLVAPTPLEWIHVSGSQLLTFQRGTGLLCLTEEHQLQGISSAYIASDAVYSNGEYWIAEEGKGLVRLNPAGDEFFHPDGPTSNFGYQLDIAHDQLYVAHGGRWANMYGRQNHLSIYNGQDWRIIPYSDTWYYTGHDIRDVVKYAIDPQDPGHFFVATYSTGVFEFKDYRAIQHYDSSNSTLRKYAESVDDYYFTCTDGAVMDTEGNLWVLNATSIGKPLHIRTKNGQWVGLDIYDNGQAIHLTTPGPIWIDQRNPQYKWIIDQREEPGVILFHDNGTPTDSIDDSAIKRNIFIDQDGKTIQPANIMCLTQDLDNRIWVGTNTGLFVIPAGVDFYTSNSCKRIIIPRNDGTNLGDYLLGNEQINCMVADGGNRMWIGTANSGLYLIEDDTITVAHFTENNSLLPSNTIQSIAIMPTTGEVFVGTAKGIASYRSDASAPQEDLSQAYAFPNPARPNYGGVISIAGLMENTMVNIVDAGGNLVCKTRSHGGLAVWSGYLPDGTKAKSGIYTALCNEPNGTHTVVKILVL